jgi:hypothetical protein
VNDILAPAFKPGPGSSIHKDDEQQKQYPCSNVQRICSKRFLRIHMPIDVHVSLISSQLLP